MSRLTYTAQVKPKAALASHVTQATALMWQPLFTDCLINVFVK